MNIDPDIPRDVRTLIDESIDSVVQLELLLLLHKEPTRAWTAEDVARELRIDAAWAAGQLDELGRRGLAATDRDREPSSYRYAPGSADLARATDGLAAEYASRRVTVISRIYSKPTDPLRTFADAFRFRKAPRKEDPGHG